MPYLLTNPFPRAALAASSLPLALGLLLPRPILAASITLAPSADTSLMEVAPLNNMGAVQSLAVGMTAHDLIARALVKFDLGALPPNATVTSARLVLPVVRMPLLVEDATFNLHRVTVAWGEGNKGLNTLTGNGAPASAGEATWSARLYPLTLWGTGGGQPDTDYIATPSASAASGAVIAFTGTEAVLEDIQLWRINPSSNYGWLIKDAAEETGVTTARRLGSRENTSAVPQLLIEYTENPFLQIIGVANDAGQICFSFATRTGKSYTVERRPNVATGNWEIIQTIPTVPNASIVRVCDPLAPGSGSAFYRVAER